MLYHFLRGIIQAIEYLPCSACFLFRVTFIVALGYHISIHLEPLFDSTFGVKNIRESIFIGRSRAEREVERLACRSCTCSFGPYFFQPRGVPKCRYVHFNIAMN